MKARDPDPARSLAACKVLRADELGLLRQRDTYFRVAHGRLKLREEGAAAELKAALAAALGVSATIVKARRLFVWEGVRIHLDRVRGLGAFIELEAVIGEGALDPGSAGRRVEELRRTFAIEDDRLIGQSYCDLAIAGG